MADHLFDLAPSDCQPICAVSGPRLDHYLLIRLNLQTVTGEQYMVRVVLPQFPRRGDPSSAADDFQQVRAVGCGRPDALNFKSVRVHGDFFLGHWRLMLQKSLSCVQ